MAGNRERESVRTQLSLVKIKDKKAEELKVLLSFSFPATPEKRHSILLLFQWVGYINGEVIQLSSRTQAAGSIFQFFILIPFFMGIIASSGIFTAIISPG